MLWPQPWVKEFCHLGAIPRKPDNPEDPFQLCGETQPMTTFNFLVAVLWMD